MRAFGSGRSMPGQVAVGGDGGEERDAGRDGEAEGCTVDEGAGDRGVEHAGLGGWEVPGDGGADGQPGGLGQCPLTVQAVGQIKDVKPW